MSEDGELNSVAGNTISVPVIGAILSVLMATSVKNARGIDIKALRSQSDFEKVIWIGPHRVSLEGIDGAARVGRSKRPLADSEPSASSKKTKKSQQKLDTYLKRK